MKSQKINRNKHLHVRLTPEEYQKLHHQFTTSSSQKFSEHIRKILLDKPIKMYHRNQSTDDLMAVLIVLKDELNAIANNYNQVVKKLHMLNNKSDLSGWISLNEIGRKALNEKITEIKEKISQINDKWLQE
ncbi:plasmid mobilization protein [Chitinophaga hostae]|uniref:Plasmid mobilization relaxosome protein MobC n=1 Tax=Chitinophaga hostae TaxID=2831022 RepID=A0ABS5IVX4_9BACT|nr:plasmid mobilization relaxosome protein MobC [Chitinophaga hostae]MBS0027109.1 plasmid mobilization relaxosome protein MobC [Chitinophaga hostae]